MTSSEQILDKLIANRMTQQHKFKGFTEQEVQAVMNAQGVKRLPKLYRDLLLMVGHNGAGILKMGTTSGQLDFSRYLINAKPSMRMAMSRDEITKPSFPEDAFVFVNILDDTFTYFLTDNDDDDPPVYRYCQYDEVPTIRWLSLSAYFNDIIDRRTKYLKS